MKRILAVLLTLFISAGFSVGGETVLSADDQRKYEDLNQRLEDIDPTSETYEIERLKIYKGLLELQPEDPIYSYYVEDLTEKITAKKSSTDKKRSNADDEKGVDESRVFVEKQKMDNKAEGFTVSPVLKSGSEFQDDALKLCVEKWTKHGELDKRMYDRCVKMQMFGYKDLKELHDRYVLKKIYSDILFPYCSWKWTKRGVVDVHMMAYCLKTEMAGFKEVVNYRKQYNKSEVNKIVERALMRYGSWKIAAYKIKRHFE